MATLLQRINRVKNWCKNNYILEWSLVVTGAVVFTAGLIAGTIASRNSTISWAVFDFVIGIAGFIVFFVYALELFFKLTMSVIMSFQETLTDQVEGMRHRNNTADAGTMTSYPTESRKMLMTFPAIDRKKSLACDRHPRMKYSTLLDREESNNLQISQTANAKCPVSVHASEDCSQEPFYYEFDDSCKTESLVKDSSTNQTSNHDEVETRKFPETESINDLESRKILRCIKTLNLSPGKMYAAGLQYHSLSNKLVRRKMAPSTQEYEMSFMTSTKDSKSDVEQPFSASSEGTKPGIVPQSFSRNIEPFLQSTTFSVSSRSSTEKCSKFSEKNRLLSDLHKPFQEPEKEHTSAPFEYVHSNLNYPNSDKNSKSKLLQDINNDSIFSNNAILSSGFPRKQSSHSKETDRFDSNPHSQSVSCSNTSGHKLYIRSKRSSLLNLSAEDNERNQSLEHVQRFY